MSSEPDISSLSEPNISLFDFLQNFAINYPIFSDMAMFLILYPVLHMVYDQTYLLLTYVLPEWQKTYFNFIKKNTKLNNFVIKLVEDKQLLFKLRFGLTVGTCLLGWSSLFSVAFLLKLVRDKFKEFSNIIDNE